MKEAAAFLLSLLWLSLLNGCQSRIAEDNDTHSRRGAERETVASSDVVSGLIPLSSKHVEHERDFQRRLIDPKRDGWKSEVFAEEASRQLRELLNKFREPTSLVSADQLVRYLSNEYSGGDLRPRELVPRFQNDEIQVWRARSPLTRSGLRRNGRQGFLESVRDLLAPLHDIGPATFHAKIIDVDITRDLPTTVCLFESESIGKKLAIQQNAKWSCTWRGEDGKQPVLESIEIMEFEEVRTVFSGKWFSDCTASAMESVPAFGAQLSHGLNHWMHRVERSHGMDDSVRSGMAVGDANGDGLEDIYRCQGPGLPNLLLLQKPDGTFRDVSAEAGGDWLDRSASAIFVDLDNDGDQDLAVSTMAGLILHENLGMAEFATHGPFGRDDTDGQSLSAVDYDGDGDLDLFLCVYLPPSAARQGDFLFHDATTGGKNILFRNDFGVTHNRKWQLTDVTEDSGLLVGARRYSLACSWEDYDNDGDPDLYVANDYGRNYLYRNHNGRFEDVTDESGLIDAGFGMSVSWGDYNRDGHMDVYVGNMFSSAGSRITRQPEFQSTSDESRRAMFQRMAKGNTLFAGSARGLFRDVTQECNVAMGRWAWSSLLVDLNNDGWQDMVVANGYITTADAGDL